MQRTRIQRSFRITIKVQRNAFKTAKKHIAKKVYGIFKVPASQCKWDPEKD
jgi:hypothetical protein